jgi:hypothetical protein
MIPSLNEIEMTVWKAARGAGLAWGLAEEVAQAARWLGDRGFDWAEPMVAALADAERRGGRLPPPVFAEDGACDPAAGEAEASPVLCGPLLTDIAGDLRSNQPLVFRRVAHPLLMLPFAAGAAYGFACALTLRIDDAVFIFENGRTKGRLVRPDAPAAGRIVLSMDEASPDIGDMRAFEAGAPRCPIAAPSLARLEAWVHRTYVPASAESRLAGAGAGLTDND